MIRYFIFNNQSPAAAYGIGTYVAQLARCLDGMARVAPVFVDTQALVPEVSERRDEAGRMHIEVPMSLVEGHSFLSCVFYFVSRWIDENCSSADEIVFHFNYSQHAPLAYMLKERYFKAKIIYTVHYQLWSFALRGDYARFKTLLSPASETNFTKEEEMLREELRASVEEERRMLLIANKAIALSRFTENVLVECYDTDASKVSVVPNVVHEEKEEDRLPLKSFQDEQKRYLLYVGRLDENKGIRQLLRAFRRIHERHPETHLIVVGEGDFSVMSETDGIWEAVTFTGRMAKESLSRVYDAAYMGIHPSFVEQCSYTLIEMMQHGLPVVATDCMGNAEMLSEMPQCLVRVRGDMEDADFVEALAEKVCSLLAGPAQREALAGLARKKYEAMFSSDETLSDAVNETLSLRSLLAEDTLRAFDLHAIGLVNARPECMNLDFFGLSGLALYFVLRMSDDGLEESGRFLLAEHFIYLMEWILELVKECSEEEVCALKGSALAFLLSKIQAKDFCPKFIVTKILELLAPDAGPVQIGEEEVLRNQLRLFNHKF